MNQGIFLAAFSLFCICISVMSLKFFKTTWVYVFVSTILPAMALIGLDVIWTGDLSVWADIAFVVSMLIAFAWAIASYFFERVMAKWRKSSQ